MYTIVQVQKAGLTVQFELVIPCASSARRGFQVLLEPSDPSARAEQPLAAAAAVPSLPTHHPPPLKISSHLSRPSLVPGRK